MRSAGRELKIGRRRRQPVLPFAAACLQSFSSRMESIESPFLSSVNPFRIRPFEMPSCYDAHFTSQPFFSWNLSVPPFWRDRGCASPRCGLGWRRDHSRGGLPERRPGFPTRSTATLPMPRAFPSRISSFPRSAGRAVALTVGNLLGLLFRPIFLCSGLQFG